MGLDRWLACQGYILDLCRWSGFCPASKNYRLIINKKGDIFTCFSQTPVGNIKSADLKGIKASIKRLSLKIIRQRRCAQCKVKDTCSKCLFINELSATEYCKLRNSLPEITTVAKSIFIARKLEAAV